jgi:hypothetical protein
MNPQGATELPSPPTAHAAAAAKKIVRLARSRRVAAATAARELASLRTSIAEKELQCDQLSAQLLLTEQNVLSQRHIRWNHAFASSLPSEAGRHLTGLDNDNFTLLAGLMAAAFSKDWPAETSFEDAFVIFLIKLRLDLPFDILALPSEIPTSTLCRHFHLMLSRISHLTQAIFCGKTREDIMCRADACCNLPDAPGHRAGLIMDTFEVS